ncbi:MAG: hypothetical protein ACRC8S_04440 [Fimbriiglobus sp.]
MRRKMDDDAAILRFAQVWDAKLEPEIRKAPVISAAGRKNVLKPQELERRKR